MSSNTTDYEMFNRIGASVCFLTSALALITVTVFSMNETLRPALMGLDQSSSEIQEMLVEMYPFAYVNEIRLIYCGLVLIPVLLPFLFQGKAAAWTTLFLSTLLTIVNIEDAFAHNILEGTPALISMRFSFRWAKAV